MKIRKDKLDEIRIAYLNSDTTSKELAILYKIPEQEIRTAIYKEQWDLQKILLKSKLDNSDFKTLNLLLMSSNEVDTLNLNSLKIIIQLLNDYLGDLSSNGDLYEDSKKDLPRLLSTVIKCLQDSHTLSRKIHGDNISPNLKEKMETLLTEINKNKQDNKIETELKTIYENSKARKPDDLSPQEKTAIKIYQELQDLKNLN